MFPGSQLAVSHGNQLAMRASNVFNQLMNESAPASVTPSGKVYLIGAGPGDPGLITLRGVELLGRADVVLYDFLANPRLLEYARSDALIQCVGKHGVKQEHGVRRGGDAQGAVWSQELITRRMLELAGEGKHVARLKGGDPSVFAQAGDEMEALRAAGVALEIVPGVTAALAAASFAGTPLTHRARSSAVALLTGREGSGKQTSALDFEAFARFPGTLVVYMGVVSASRWTSELMKAGKPAETPCTIVRRCSLPDQQTSSCRLDEVAAVVESQRIRPPVIFVIGDVARETGVSWFEKRPLFGVRVVVTRPQAQARSLSALLEEQGAFVIEQPAIELAPVEGRRRELLDDALNRLSEFDWVVFSSRNGVEFTMQRLAQLNLDARAFGPARIAAVGPTTAATLAKFGLRADWTAKQSDQDGLAAELSGVDRGSYLLLRASRGRDTLAIALEKTGASVEQVVTYESRDVEELSDTTRSQLQQTPPDWIIAASSASATAAHRLLTPFSPQAKWAAISSTTAKTLSELGIRPAAIAENPSNAALVQSLVACLT